MTAGEVVSPGREEARARPARGRRASAVIIATLVAGAAAVVGILAAEPGSALFYVLALTAPAVWLAGSRLAGPPRLTGDRGGDRRAEAAAAIGAGAVVGVASFSVFFVLYLALRDSPFIGDGIDRVLASALDGPVGAIVVIAVLNGLGEEAFFRGTFFDRFADRAPVLRSTLVYVGVTSLTLNPALTAASVLMGAAFAGLRRSSGGVLAPAVAHGLWSALMVLVVGGLQ